MPIYEFYCPDNHTVYQFLARSLAHQGRIPRCPDDPAYTLQKQISRFAIVGKAREPTEGDPFAGLDDRQMEALMSEVEQDMAGLDEASPDPRQMGRVLRKMSDLMGGKAPPELREAVRRLEAGEDPEKLEAEFGALETGDGGLFHQVRSLLHGGARPPVRNPKLYELSEWLP